MTSGFLTWTSCQTRPFHAGTRARVWTSRPAHRTTLPTKSNLNRRPTGTGRPQCPHQCRRRRSPTTPRRRTRKKWSLSPGQRQQYHWSCGRNRTSSSTLSLPVVTILSLSPSLVCASLCLPPFACFSVSRFPPPSLSVSFTPPPSQYPPLPNHRLQCPWGGWDTDVEKSLSLETRKVSLLLRKVPRDEMVLVCPDGHRRRSVPGSVRQRGRWSGPRTIWESFRPTCLKLIFLGPKVWKGHDFDLCGEVWGSKLLRTGRLKCLI